MVQRTVLKVPLSCEKSKKKILKSISDLEGVDKIEIDEAKETITVTGDADPYAIIIKAKKATKGVDVLTIGPPPAPAPAPPNKPDDKKPEPKPLTPPCTHIPCACVACRPLAVVHVTEDPCTTTCSIL